MKQPTLQPAILVVEDDPSVRALIHRMVERLCSTCDVISLETGAAALAALAVQDVPIVITDYRLPGMNGLALTRTIKAIHPSTHVLIISALTQADLAREAAAAGADGYLAKPFMFAELAIELEQALDDWLGCGACACAAEVGMRQGEAQAHCISF